MKVIDCDVFDFEIGIEVAESTRVTIAGNGAHHMVGAGPISGTDIYVADSSGIVLIGNTAADNRVGLWATGGDWIGIWSNKAQLMRARACVSPLCHESLSWAIRHHGMARPAS